MDLQWQYTYKQRIKNSVQIRLHTKSTYTITNINDINMDSTIPGSVNDSSKLILAKRVEYVGFRPLLLRTKKAKLMHLAELQ